MCKNSGDGCVIYRNTSEMTAQAAIDILGMPGMCPFSGVKVPYGKGSLNR